MITASRAARFAAVYAALMAAHDMGDHVAQTDAQAQLKTSGVPGRWYGPMAGHLLTYHATQAAALAALALVGVRPRWSRTYAGMVFSAGTHAFIDRRWPVRALLRRTGSARFADATIPPTPVMRQGVSGPVRWQTQAQPIPLHGVYLADQACHHACLFVAALIISGGRS